MEISPVNIAPNIPCTKDGGLSIGYDGSGDREVGIEAEIRD